MANADAAELLQPTVGAFDVPSALAQAAPMKGSTLGKDWNNAATT